MKLYIVTLPTPKDPPICYISHFVSEIHAERKEEVLLDFPVGINSKERRWVPKDSVSLLEV